MSAARWNVNRGLLVFVALAGWATSLWAQTTEPAPASLPAAEAPGVAAPPAGGAASASEVVRSSAPGVMENYICKDLEIRLALRMLAPYTPKNFVCTKEVAGTVTLDLKEVTFQEALEAVLKVTGLACREKDNFLYIMTAAQLAEALKDERKPSLRTFRLAYVTAADAKTLITPALSSDGTAVTTPASLGGIAADKAVTGGNSMATQDLLVVRDYEENLDVVAKILQEVDARPDQVLVEATILRATLTEDNALGIDFNALGGVDFAKVSTVTDPSDLQGLTTGSLTNARDGATQIHTGTTAGISPGGISLGFFSNNVAVFLKALETVTDVTVVANPKLLIVNKQRGEVLIGDKTGYITTTTTETVSTQTVQFLDGGTRLIVRPYIAKDGIIRMEVHPEISLTTTQTLQNNIVPSQTTTETTSNIMVRDGHTIVIAGLFQEKTTVGRTQVPILGNLPYMGTLFRKTADNTVREEVIVLITPRIVRQANDEAISEQLKSDVERFRIGARKGVRWWGRDRLANCHIRQARQDLQAGRRDNALWNTDMALSLEPRMEEAIRLKERITEKAFWADESQFSSAQNIVQRMLMNDLGKPTERMVTPGKPRDASGVDEDVREKFGMTPRIEDPLPGSLPPGSIRIDSVPSATPATAPAAEGAQAPPGDEAPPMDSAASAAAESPAEEAPAALPATGAPPEAREEASRQEE